MIKDVTELKIYKESMESVPQIYQLTKRVPASEFDLIRQLQRAAKSVPANITEGFAKRASSRGFKRYLLISLVSSDESEGINKLIEKYVVLSKQINTLCHKW